MYLSPTSINISHVALWHGTTFRITGPLRGETTGRRQVPFTKGYMRSIGVHLLLAGTSCWNSQFTDDLWRHFNGDLKFPASTLNIVLICRWNGGLMSNCIKLRPGPWLSGVPDYFDRNKILSGYDLSHYQVPHCIESFLLFCLICVYSWQFSILFWIMYLL